MERIAEPWSFASPDEVLERLLRMQAVTSALSAATSVETVADVLVREVVDVLGASAMVVYSLAPGETEARLVGGAGIPAAVTQSLARMSIDVPLPMATALRTGKPQFFENQPQLFDAYPHLRSIQTVRKDTLHAVVAIPFVEQGHSLGGFSISFSEAREFSPIDRRFLQGLADQCAQALDRAGERIQRRKMEQDLERQRQRLQLLADLDAALAASHGMHGMKGRLATVVERLVPAVGEVAVLDLLDERGAFEGSAMAHAEPGRGRSLRARRLGGPFSDGSATPAAQAFRSQQVVLVKDFDEEGLVRMGEEAVSTLDGAVKQAARVTRSGLFVPLIADGRPAGVLSLGRSEEYTDEDLHFAQDVGRRISLGIERWLLQDRCVNALEAREEFFTLAAHELKTPLTVAQLHVQSLARRVPGDEQLATSARAASAALRRMSWLVDAVRALAMALAGHAPTESANVGILANNVLDRISSQLAAEGVEVKVETSGDLQVDVNKSLVESGIEALISYATQDLPFGQVRLVVEGTPKAVVLSTEHPSGAASKGMSGEAGRQLGSLGEFLVRRVAQAHKAQAHAKVDAHARVEQTDGVERLVLELLRVPEEDAEPEC